jgi:NADPH:quinone reductase-like Zn-dependent oxidoreductase
MRYHRTMLAATKTTYGTEKVIVVRQIERPSPTENQLLIKVHCTTVNRTDCGFLSGKPYIVRFFSGFPKPKMRITGSDFAGEVVEKGSAVNDFKIGDRIFGFNDQGLCSHAHYVLIDQNEAITHIPENVSFENAVASLEGAHYALNMMNKVPITSSSKVLVNGATGAIGSAAIQQLKAQNIYVTAVGNTPNIDRIKAMGADKVYDYLKDDFTNDNEQYDFIFDAVGKSTFFKIKHLLQPNGIYISSELGPNWQNIWLAMLTPIFSKKKVVFPIPKDLKVSIKTMSQLLGENKFKPMIDRHFTLDQIHEAFKYVRSGEKQGNVILKIEKQ